MAGKSQFEDLQFSCIKYALVQRMSAAIDLDEDTYTNLCHAFCKSNRRPMVNSGSAISLLSDLQSRNYCRMICQKPDIHFNDGWCCALGALIKVLEDNEVEAAANVLKHNEEDILKDYNELRTSRRPY